MAWPIREKSVYWDDREPIINQMKISMKRFYLLALAAALAFAGCGKDKDEKIPPPDGR